MLLLLLLEELLLAAQGTVLAVYDLANPVVCCPCHVGWRNAFGAGGDAAPGIHLARTTDRDVALLDEPLRGVPLRGHGGPLADAGELLWLSVRLLILLILRHRLGLWESVALLRELNLLRRRVKVRVLCLEELSLRLCELGVKLAGIDVVREGVGLDHRTAAAGVLDWTRCVGVHVPLVLPHDYFFI